MSSTYKKEVERLQKELNYMTQDGIFHILNGESMYADFQKEAIFQEGTYLPFNEAMAVNEATVPLFEEPFKKVRAAGHGVTVQQYTEKVMPVIQFIRDEKPESIVLWFGEDVFCQMNALTILAFLEQEEYARKVYLHYFDEEKFGVNTVEIQLGMYADLYESTLVKKKKSNLQCVAVIKKAVDLYFELQSEENPVIQFIKTYPHVDKNELTKKLLTNFKEVGYGDTQYLKMIEEVRA